LPTRNDFFYPSGFFDKLGLLFVHDEVLTKGKVKTQISIAMILRKTLSLSVTTSDYGIVVAWLQVARYGFLGLFQDELGVRFGAIDHGDE
jgi:hypothetical protein